MKVVICEDERYWSDKLEKFISRWAVNRQINAHCDSFSTPKELIDHISEYKNTDVALLDISLGSEVIDGIAAAERIRKMGSQIPIIFVTGNSFRAVDGYLVAAVGFIEKPIDEKRLSLFLDRILEKKKTQRIIRIASETEMVSVLENDVVYAEVRNHTVTYHTIQKQISIRGTLANILGLLGSENFVQIHRSFVIAKSKIYKIKSTYPFSVTLFSRSDNIDLPVSRSYIQTLLAAYSDDLLERFV